MSGLRALVVTGTFHYSGNIAVNYETSGTGPTPVVLLHGFAAAIATWHDLRALFPPDRFTLYLLDLKGFGATSKPRDGKYGIEDHAAIVSAFIEQQKLVNVILAGHSMGGGVALCTVLQCMGKEKAGLIARLILISCAAYPQDIPLFLRILRKPLLTIMIFLLLPRRFIARFSLESIFFNRQAVTPERIDRYVNGYRGKGIPYAFTRSARQLDPARYARLTAAYPTITIPALIIWGANDPLIPPAMGARLNREIAGSQLVIIDNCGHNPHEERPAETYAAISRFLTSTE